MLDQATSDSDHSSDNCGDDNELVDRQLVDRGLSMSGPLST
jgi:hypothetical protein